MVPAVRDGYVSGMAQPGIDRAVESPFGTSAESGRLLKNDGMRTWRKY